MYSKSFSKSLNYKLRELELIINQLESGKEHSRIDVYLALDKTRELYEILLKVAAGQPEGQERPAASPARSVVPSDPDTAQDGRDYEAEGIIPDPVHKPKEEVQSMRDKPEETSKLLQKTDSEKEKDEKPVQDDQTDPLTDKKPGAQNGITDDKKKNGTQDIEIVADRYQSSQNYINRAMADKQIKKDLTARIQSRPISDLRNSIGLNEKFLFIKELFKGRPEKYNQCIDTLNQASTLDQALSYIRETYEWKEDDEVVEKLINLVKRKHQAE